MGGGYFHADPEYSKLIYPFIFSDNICSIKNFGQALIGLSFFVANARSLSGRPSYFCCQFLSATD
jgi:hypothetical protein